MQTSFDAIIIGGGPAGCAAAAFLARCKWASLIVDRGITEGFLGATGNIGFFPGFPEPVTGPELLKKMRRQTELEGAKLVIEAAASVSGEAGSFVVSTGSGREFSSKALVITTGAAGRTNYLNGEREFLGRGVSYDVASDGPAVARRAAAVIGKTKEAADAAIDLSRIAESVHMIIPSNRIEAGDDIVEAIKGRRNVEMHYSTSLKKINGDDHVKSITVFSAGQEKEMPVVGVFTYVHEHKPTTSFVENIVELGAGGAVKVDRNFSASTAGIFAAGDVLCAKPQMPVIAASQGILAGMSAAKYLSSL